MDEIVQISGVSSMTNNSLKRHKQGNENPKGCTRLTAALRHQQEHFPDNNATKVMCECLNTRNMCKIANTSTEQLIFKGRKKKKENITTATYRRITTSNHTSTISESNSKCYKVCKQHDALAPSNFTPLVAAATTISMIVYNNLLHNFVGSVIWHITATTAISILVTLYYFIAHTQVASAISVVASAPTSLSSLSASLLIYSCLASAAAAISMPTQTPSSLPTLLPLMTANFSFLPTTYGHSSTNSSISLGGSGSAVNGSSLPSTFMDNNYNNRINSTEITILNGISFLSTNKVSVYSIDNNNNNNNNVITVSYNNAISFNDTLDDMSGEDASEYIFDRTDVRIIFITLYTIVFCCCFFGNLLVILVVTLSRRLRSITNFFLANLALADFCVGLFCVMQNLSIYLIDSWVFGEFLCRMYQFVHSLSYTASIFILVVICMERYFAIVHPITCKQILTAARLRMVILTVWITSAVYSTPKFVFSKTIKNVHTESGREEEICVLDRKMFNSKLLDMINFGLLYVIPLLVMTVLYSKIAIALWRSSRGLQHHLAQQENGMGMHNSMYHHHQHHHHNHSHNHHLHNHQQQLAASLGTPISANSSVVSAATTLSRKQSCKYDAKLSGINLTESQVSLEADRPVVSACRKTSFYQHSHNHHQQQPTAVHPTVNHHRQLSQHSHHGLHGSQRVSHISHSSNNVLRARRGVVRMLIIFVLTFALCNLPYHARKMWQYWSRSYRGDSNFNALFTPLTFLVTYFNSGINPLLYAFLSRNFRKGMKELLMCSWRKSKTKLSTNSSMHHKRMTLQTHSIPTDTTHIGNEQL